jgi:hypothetical protein
MAGCVLILLHSGQTGVERGAQRAAVATGLPVAGFCTPNHRDELGVLSPEVRSSLTPCFETGPRVAVDANIQIASAVVVAVPDRARVAMATGMTAVMRAARIRDVPLIVVDPRSDRDALYAWIAARPPSCGSVRLYVTGPRLTRWADGERFAWQLIAGLPTASDEIVGAKRDAVRGWRHVP